MHPFAEMLSFPVFGSVASESPEDSSSRASPAAVLSHSCNRPTRSPHTFLVGIELNPGPNPNAARLLKTATADLALATATNAAASLGQAVAGKKKTNNRKKKSKGNNNMSRQPLIGAPSALSVPGSAKLNSLEGVFSVPFEGMDITLSNGDSGSAHSSFAPLYSDGTNTNSSGLDFNPTSSSNHPGAFGLAIAKVAQCFSLFRLTRLSVEYIPMFATSVSSIYTMGASGDPYDAAPTSAQQVGALSPNKPTAAWCPVIMDLNSIVKNSRMPWYSTSPVGTGDSQSRLSAPGSLQSYLTGFTNVNPSAAFGFLRFSGVIQFKNLARVDLTALAFEYSSVMKTYEKGSSSSSQSSGDCLPPKPPELIRSAKQLDGPVLDPEYVKVSV